jgi:hypothetical protein
VKDQADLRRWAGAKYRRNHRSWIADPQLTTTFTLGTPTEQQALADPDAVAAWAAGWRRWRPPEGANLEWVVRNWPSWGRQTLPARVRVVSPDAAAELAGQGQVWRRSQQIAAELRSHWSSSAYLGDALPRLIDDVTALDDADIRRLLAMTDWLVDHPESGLMPRQVAVPGIDTKWLEMHRGIVERLVTAVTGQVGMGLADEPQRFRIRVLDASLEGVTLSDLTADVDELNKLPVAPPVVLIIENLTTLAALPPMPGVMAVHGRGYAVVQLDRVGWIRGAAILYWGDLDTHGFNILSRCRSRLPQTQSVLMDSVALGEFRELAVTEPAQAHGVTGLTSAESAAYREIEQGRLRLEQERIPMDWAVGVLRSALATV